jgi:putative SOS response-associated peptidase YedK
MCGRIILTHKPKAIGGYQPEIQFESWPGPRYNITPTETVATLLNDGSSVVRYSKWGLIPTWAKDPSIGSRMINARAESLDEKPAFKKPFQKQRCIILADGYYEWKNKQPWLIRLKSHDLFALAGLWDTWNSHDGQIITSSTIITTEPNDLVSAVNNRMPVILPAESLPFWLSSDSVSVNDLKALLRPFPSDDLEMFSVSSLVNKAGVDKPECILPVDPMSLF